MKLWQTLMQLFARFGRKKPRVVLDTNVLVSGTIVRHGAPARILVAARMKRISLIVSSYLFAEYLTVMRRPHIAKRYPRFQEESEIVRRFIQANAVFVEPFYVPNVIADDPKDDAILACAVTGKARYIVSGDEHLLNLGHYRGIKILTPRDFVVNVLGENISASR